MNGVVVNAELWRTPLRSAPTLPRAWYLACALHLHSLETSNSQAAILYPTAMMAATTLSDVDGKLLRKN